jgi:AcrR family transcriptional regulator
MQTPARILKATAEERPTARNALSPHQMDRRKALLAAATTLLARHGPHTITLPDLALALGITRNALRRFFPDLDNLLAAIVTTHLLAILDALKSIPAHSPDEPHATRGAYLAATRTPLGAATEAQHLTTQYAHLLPEDEQANIAPLRQAIAGIIGGRNPQITLSFLDNPCLTLRQIDALTETLDALPEPSWAETIPPPLPARSPRPFVLPPGNTLLTIHDFPDLAPPARQAAEPHQARAGP